MVDGRFDRTHPGLFTRQLGLETLVVLGVDLEKVVEDDHEHGRRAQEDGEGVELGIRNHFLFLVSCFSFLVSRFPCLPCR